MLVSRCPNGVNYGHMTVYYDNSEKERKKRAHVDVFNKTIITDCAKPPIKRIFKSQSARDRRHNGPLSQFEIFSLAILTSFLILRSIFSTWISCGGVLHEKMAYIIGGMFANTKKRSESFSKRNSHADS